MKREVNQLLSDVGPGTGAKTYCEFTAEVIVRLGGGERERVIERVRESKFGGF